VSKKNLLIIEWFQHNAAPGGQAPETNWTTHCSILGVMGAYRLLELLPDTRARRRDDIAPGRPRLALFIATAPARPVLEGKVGAQATQAHVSAKWIRFVAAAGPATVGLSCQVASCTATRHSAEEASRPASQRRTAPNRWLKTRTATRHPVPVRRCKAFRQPKGPRGRIND
jgi:hypothetical protein